MIGGRHALGKMARACTYLQCLPPSHQNGPFTRQLASLHQAFSQDMSSLDAVAQIHRLCVSLSTAAQDIEVQHATLALQQQLYLQTRISLRQWITRHLRGDSPSPDWLSTIVSRISNYVHRWITVPTEGHIFDSHTLPFIQPPTTYTYHPLPPKSRRNTSADGAAKQVLMDAITVVEALLGIEQSATSQAQGQFLSILEETLPSTSISAFLLLPPIWDTYQAPESNLISIRKHAHRGSGVILPQDWDMLHRALQTHPFICALYDRSTPPACLLARFGEIRLQFITTARKLTLNARAKPALPHTPVDVLPTLEITKSLVDPFVDFIDAVRPYLYGRQPNISTDLWRNITAAPNKRLPFRERAPGRAHIRATFTAAAHTNKTSMVRSLIIHRGITFNAPGELTHPGLFTCREEWYNFRGCGADADESSFCDLHAYGQPTERSSENFETFWRAGGIIAQYLDQPDLPSFIDTLRFIREDGPLAGFSLPSFGDLVTFLLVEDMVYAGLVHWPTVQEFGAEVAELGKGAKKAMSLLGLTPPDASKSAVAAAFVQLYAYVLDFDLIL